MSAVWTLPASTYNIKGVEPVQLPDGTLIVLSVDGTSYTLSYSTDHATLHTIATWTGTSNFPVYWLTVDASGNIFVSSTDKALLSTTAYQMVCQAFVKGSGYSWTAKGWMIASTLYSSHGVESSGAAAARPLWANTGGGTAGAGHLVMPYRTFDGGAFEDVVVVADAGALLAGAGTPYAGYGACGSVSGSGGLAAPAASQDGFGSTAGVVLFNGTPGNGIYGWTVASDGTVAVGTAVTLPTIYSSAVPQWLSMGSGLWALVYNPTNATLSIAVYSAAAQVASPVAGPAQSGANSFAAFVSAETANRIYVLWWSASAVGTLLRQGCNVSPIAWDAASVTENSSFGNATAVGGQGAPACVREPSGPPDDFVAYTYDGSGTYELSGAVSQPETSVNTPTITSPANGTYEDVSSGATITWDYNSADGSSQAGFCVRYKVAGAASYLYWNASTSAGQSTPVYNSGTLGSETFPSGALSDGRNYNVSVSTLSNTGIESAFAPDVTLVAAADPSVSVSSPTGTVSSTSYPVVAWVDSLGVGLAQASYQVRVFSAAQAAVSGFDPATSAATWDSGVVDSTATSSTVATALANASGWKAYVQVGQTGGQMSAWSSTTFTVAATLPAAPSLTATATTDGNGTPCVELVATDNEGSLSGTTTLTVTRGDGTVVRGCPEAVATAGASVTLYDYEVESGVAYSYSAAVSATSSGDTVTSTASASASATVTLSSWWAIDPLDPSTATSLDVQNHQASRNAASAVHTVLGPPDTTTYPVVLASGVWGHDGTLTVQTKTAAEYAAVELLTITQSTMWLSNPFGDGHWVRFGPMPGGMSSGSGNKQHDTTTQQGSTAANPVRQVTITYIGQDRP